MLSGQSLIRAAELRSVTTDISRYRAAIYTFRDKYFALPGDITNAQSFWGTKTVCPGDNTTPSTDARTCNGNGNGQIEFFTAGNTNDYEAFKAWQHLASAGLIEGSYTGVSAVAAAGLSSQPGLNVPKSRISNAGVTLQWVGARSSDPNYFDASYGNVLEIGTPVTNAATHNPLLKPEEAWNIDTKIDDGKPGLGTVSSFVQHTACYVNTNNYALTTTAVNCALIVKTNL